MTFGDEDTCKLSCTFVLIPCLCVAFISYIVSFNRYVWYPLKQAEILHAIYARCNNSSWLLVT
jgi:hypothetical protein